MLVWLCGGSRERAGDYFGFDLVPGGDAFGGTKVSGITAYLRYRCDGDRRELLLVETAGYHKMVGRRFRGTTEDEKVVVDGDDEAVLSYKTRGRLGEGRNASGSIEATLTLGSGEVCRAGNDGAWSALRRGEVEVPGG